MVAEPLSEVWGRVLIRCEFWRQTIQSKQPSEPLDVTCRGANAASSHLVARELSIIQHFDSLGDLEALIMSVFFGFPALLNVAFADPPFVERVDGTVGVKSLPLGALEPAHGVQNHDDAGAPGEGGR